MKIYPCATRTRSYCGQPERLEVRWKAKTFNSLTTVAKDCMILEIKDGCDSSRKHNAKQMGRADKPRQSV